MLHIKTIIFTLLINLSSLIAQSNVLVIDYNNNFSSDQSNNNSRIYNRLVATQTSVTRINAIPATISNTYDEVWIFGNMGATTATILNPVVNYINAGGAVYVQSEVSCCNNEAAFADNIINAVTTVGASISHNTTTGLHYQFQTNPLLDCPSSAWDPSYGAAVRPFYGTPSNNVLFEAIPGCSGSVLSGDVVGVQFGACDMISGQGAFISNGDFNIFPYRSSCGTAIVGNANRDNIIDLIANLFDSLLICAPYCSNVLPVELLHFEGQALGHQNALYWTTSSEINNSHFTIERSMQGFDYYPIGEVQGAGNSQVQLEYEFIDEEAPTGTTYYRLKQTDYNGDFTYSKIIAITNESRNIIVSPNPFSAELTIDMSMFNEDLTIQVYSLTGQLVWDKAIRGNQLLQVDLSFLAASTYVIQVKGKTFIEQYRIIKQ